MNYNLEAESRSLVSGDKNIAPSEEKINHIVDCSACSDRHKIDMLLEMDCKMYTNLGIDSTKEEKKFVKTMSGKIYRAIRKIDKTLGDTMVRAMDK